MSAPLPDEKGVLETKTRDRDPLLEEFRENNIFLTSDNKILLNVGGKIFATTLLTLTRDRSMFTAMFSGRFAPQRDKAGSYFIDRDPTYFGHVLNYLRDGALSIEGMLSSEKKALLREARYFQVTGLINLLQTDAKRARASIRSELSHEKEYKLLTNIADAELPNVFKKMTMIEGYDFENWIAPIRKAKDKEDGVHLLFSKKLSRGELMLLDRLQTHM